MILKRCGESDIGIVFESSCKHLFASYETSEGVNSNSSKLDREQR